MTLAQTERHDLVTTMVETGPDAPTLCGDWTVRDLAAHLVIRERRLDAAVGILLPPLSGYTAKVQDAEARTPWPELAEKVRSGPPVWSPYKLLDSQMNLGEMFVHHEDVRRAGTEWTPRALSAEVQDALFKMVGMIGKLSYRKSPVSVTLRTRDGREAVFQGGKKAGVVLTGEPMELLLHAFGRDAVVVDFDGEQADVDSVNGLDRGL